MKPETRLRKREKTGFLSRRLTAMIRKEFAQLFRDIPILGILVWAFTAAVYMAGHTISMEVRDYPVLVYDLSHSPESREIIARLRQPYFKLVDIARSDRMVVDYLDAGKASLAVIIPPDFARDLRRGTAAFQVISDGTHSMSATIAGAHIADIATRLGIDVLEERASAAARQLSRMPQIDARIRVAYNPNMENAWFSSMLEMFNIITMVSALLTAAALVREKEGGTLEHLLVSPLRPGELFLAKILPTMVMVTLFSMITLFGIIQGVFGTPIRGSILLFYSVGAIYIFTVASLGIMIAMFARNIAQAMMLLLLIIFPMIFLSGAFTPPESMAPWMQVASLLSPMRYFIDFGYQVLFKGNGLADAWPNIVGIVVLGGTMFGLAIWRFRRLYG